MFCGNCGKEIKEGNKFCTNCGAMVEEASNSNANNALIEDFSNQIKKIKCVTEYNEETTIDKMDTIKFGTYPQSDITGNKSDPIEWLILEKNDNEVFLLSKYILDCKSYYNGDNEDVSWSNSDLRKWLNSYFLKKAFSDAEKNKIISKSIINEEDENTTDMVFCLSVEECEKYFAFNNSDKRLATCGSDYAKNVENGGSKLNVSISTDEKWWDGNSDYWLRTPGKSQLHAYHVYYDGNANDGWSMSAGDIGVRPVIRIKLK